MGAGSILRYIVAITCHLWQTTAMKFTSLVAAVADEPVFTTGWLLVGDVDPDDVRRQISRWVAAGRVVQLRRGLYALAPPYAKVSPHPFVLANRLVPGSYVSLHSALAHHGEIPEYVARTTSVTPGRPEQRETPYGLFEYRHLDARDAGGYRRERLPGGQEAFVAGAGKALADLVYLERGADSLAYLRELRLAEPAALRLEDAGALGARPKVRRAFARLARLEAE